MTAPDYDYYGLIASTWDLSRGDTSNWSDRFFFLDIINQYGQPALDLGCGTGRLILDYMAQGIDIDGVDNSAEMLAICRQKAEKLKLSPTLYQQSMEALDLPRRYRTIVAPSSVLQLVTDVDQARAVIRRLFMCLESGGVLIGSFSFEWREGDELELDWKLMFDSVRPEDGATVKRWNREWYEPDKQVWHAEQRFEVELNGEIIAQEFHRASPEGRYYSQVQAADLYRDSGFTDVQVLHEFTFHPALSEDRLFCVLGVKP